MAPREAQPPGRTEDARGVVIVPSAIRVTIA
jgi:hypothetical protein